MVLTINPMMMKQHICSLLLAMVCVFPVTAQNDTGKVREQVEAFRVAYYTRELDLTSREAQVFWPVYNEYADELERNKAAQREKQQTLRQVYNSGSEEDVDRLMQELLALKRDEVDVTIQYHDRFKEVIPVRKVALLYRAETEFKRRLLEHLQQRRQERRNGMRRP